MPRFSTSLAALVLGVALAGGAQAPPRPGPAGAEGKAHAAVPAGAASASSPLQDKGRKVNCHVRVNGKTVLVNKELAPGMNHVYTLEDGHRVFARVEKGVITQVVVKNRDGQVVPVELETHTEHRLKCWCFRIPWTRWRICLCIGFSRT
jgi:hypothetical protein